MYSGLTAGKLPIGLSPVSPSQPRSADEARVVMPIKHTHFTHPHYLVSRKHQARQRNLVAKYRGALRPLPTRDVSFARAVQVSIEAGFEDETQMVRPESIETDYVESKHR